MKAIAHAVEHFNDLWPFLANAPAGFSYKVICTKQEFIDYVENNKVKIDWDKELECDAGEVVRVAGGSYLNQKVIVNSTSYLVYADGNPTDKNLPDCYRVRNKKSDKEAWIHNATEILGVFNKYNYLSEVAEVIHQAIKSGELPEVKRD